MVDHLGVAADGVTETWRRERLRLVKLCARLTGDASVAEDLAQEALLEAWRHRHNLREPDRFSPWLSGVARNVCLRWAREHQRVVAHTTTLAQDADDESENDMDRLVDTAGVEIELERKELAALLDQALDLLPDETRAAFLAHVVEGVPLAQISAHLGVNASAVAMRMQRGKLILRRVLASELGQHPADDNSADMPWDDTPLWCTLCGRRRLRGRYRREEGELRLWCPSCNAYPRDPSDYVSHTNNLQILGGVKGYKRAYNRLTAWIDRYYPPGIRTWSVPCMRCGRATRLCVGLPDALSAKPDDRYKLYHRCAVCGQAPCLLSLHWLLLAKPEALRFQAQHPRIRTLPFDEVEADGRPAVITRFESVSSRDRLVMVTDAASFELLHVYEGGL